MGGELEVLEPAGEQENCERFDLVGHACATRGAPDRAHPARGAPDRAYPARGAPDRAHPARMLAASAGRAPLEPGRSSPALEDSCPSASRRRSPRRDVRGW